jgi:Ca2+-binding EF-hand superfamily protein
MHNTPSKSYERKLRLIFQVCVGLFQKYDADGSGYLDRDEIKVLYDDLCHRQGLPKMTDVELDDYLAKWYENGDVEIDLDEFLSMCQPLIENHMQAEAKESEAQKKSKRELVFPI